MKVRLNTGVLQLLSVMAIVGFTFFLSEALKPNNQQQTSEGPTLNRNQAPVVSVDYFSSENYQPVIEVNGEIVARTKIDVTAQVTGRVASISDAFRPGGEFRKGNVLFTLDSQDFTIRLEQAKADEAIANSNYILQKSKADIAESDWRKVYPNTEPPALAILEPQMIAAKANLDKAIAARKAAELALERTTILAPFDGKVLSTNIGVGQLVGINQSVGMVYSSDSVEIESPITAENIATMADKDQYSVSLYPTHNPSQRLALGRLVGFGAQIDPKSRMGMAYIKPTSTDKLAIGTFLKAVIIKTDSLEAVRIPSKLVSMSSVWVVSQNKLNKVSLSVLGYDGQDVLVAPFDQHGGIALTKPANAFVGQTVRVQNENEVSNAY